MTATCGVYEVTGTRRYRDHAPGTTFAARLDEHAEERAIARGDIRFLERLIPALEPGSFTFPDGWLTSHQHAHNRGAERRLTH